MDRIKHSRQWLEATDEMLLKRGKEAEMPILSVPRLNEFLWGLHRQELTIIGARPANGKSILAIQLAWDMAKQGRSVYFMSLEMAVPRILERIFSSEYKVDNSLLWRGALRTDEAIKVKYIQFKEQIAKTHFILSDMIGRTAQDIDVIEQAFSKHPDVLVIDHLNEISGDKKATAIEQYLTRIRELAIRQNVAVIVVCQVNRSSRLDDDKTPQLHQLKGSGAAEEKADNVILLHYPYIYKASTRGDVSINELEVYIAKNRYGATGFAKVYIHPQYSRISDDGAIFKEENERAVGRDDGKVDWSK